MLQCFTTEPRKLKSKAHYKVHMIMTHILHTAEITNVNNVMFCKYNKEDGRFQARKETEEDVFCLVTRVVVCRSAESEGLRFDLHGD